MPNEKADNVEAADKLGSLIEKLADTCALLVNGQSRLADENKAIREALAAIQSRADAEEKEGEEEKAKADEGEGKIEMKGEPKEVAADRKDDDDDDAKKDSAVERGKEGYVSDRRDDDDDDDDKAKADTGAENEKEAEKMADSVTRAELDALRAEIARLNARTPAVRSDSDREKFAEIQAMAEPAFQAFGDRAPVDLQGDTPLAYKRRLAEKLKGNSPRWKDKRISGIADEGLVDMALSDCIADSISAARTGADVAPGHLVKIEGKTHAGTPKIEYRGSPRAWMAEFSHGAVI